MKTSFTMKMASFFSETEVCRKVCETCPGEKLGELGVLDYILLALVLAVSAGIGIFYIIKEYRMAHKATSEDILMGGRDMGIFPIAMSLMASFMSAITVLGTPTEMYNVNTAFWLANVAMVPTVVITNHIFLPFFHKLSFTSAYELLYMGVVLYAPSLALNAVTDLPLSMCIITIGVVCTFYTALGGLKAVVWSDTFQTFIVMAGLIAVVIRGSDELGGLGEVWRLADEGGRIFFFEWSVDPVVRHSVWSLVLGSTVGQLTIYAANQTMIHRYLSIKETRSSKKSLYLSLPLTLVLSSLVCLAGLVIFASYSRCDPYLMNIVRARDQLLPLLVMDKLTILPGLAGLFVACLFSASLSSISSGLNALAIVILEDLIKPFWKWRQIDVKPSTTGTVAKFIGLIGGAACIGLGFLFSMLGQTVLQIMLSIFGMVGGPLLGLFICGIFFPYIESQGALYGFIISSFVSFWMGIGATVVLPVPPVKGVSTEACLNRVILDMKCKYNNITSEMLANMTQSTIMVTNLNPGIIPKNATTEPLEYDGNNLWLYHVSYLWYALSAVVIHIVVSHIITLFVSYFKGPVHPEDTDGNLVHDMVDRVCCYFPLACRKIERTNDQESAENTHEMTSFGRPSKYKSSSETLNGGQENPIFIEEKF